MRAKITGAVTFAVMATTIAFAQPCTPKIDSVTPALGPSTGGTTVTITSPYVYACWPFEPLPGVIVTFGGVPAQVIATSTTQLVVIAPPHAPGTVDVAFSSYGTATKTQAFTFVDAPSAPTLGAGLAALLAISIIGIALFRIR
jgi:uncharacterized protein (TIGR03437 family)